MSALGLACLLGACAGTTPAPEVASLPPAPPPEAPTEADVPALTAAEFLMETEDSAADAAVLELLAASRPENPMSGGASRPAGRGPNALEVSPVTWDIDVEPYVTHDRVQFYLDFFQGKARKRFAIWLQRLPRYEDMIREELAKRDLPGDLVYLALIESGLSNSAVSRSRAVGMWQFMKGTGKMYGLRVDSWIDERRDPYKATKAAAHHLADLRDRFGSLYLAAAAYNAGPGRVSRGLKRLPAANGEEQEYEGPDGDYFRLSGTRYLRRETKDYVPKLIAAALIAKEPEKYGFPSLLPSDPLVYDSIIVPDATGLDVLARLADTSVRAIRALNHHIRRMATPPGRETLVRLPLGTGEQTAARYAELPAKDRVTFLEHYVRKGETLGHIARRYRVSLSLLRDANPRARPRALRIGMRLIVPTSGTIPKGVRAAASAPQPKSRGSYHRVRRGESIWLIARRYGITRDQLRKWNGLSGDFIKAGQRLRVAPPA
jgi:membrane-bound lytic murein transglycosylase D